VSLVVAGLRKSFGATSIINGIDLTVRTGERHAVIGPNGAGKSTLFHLVSGRLRPDAGTITLNGRDITGLAPHEVFNLGLARSFQVTSLFPRLSVFENLRAGAMRSAGCGVAFWRFLDGYRALRERAEELLVQLGLERRRYVLAGSLAYAEQRALEIGVTIAGGADTILLDEPTAGMSRHETERAVGLIRRISEGRTLVMIEHDLGVVFGLADRITVLADGRVIASGTPDEVRGDRAVRTAYLGAAADALC
jgi:branched-chain amino acid transport system ATP-binding protein